MRRNGKENEACETDRKGSGRIIPAAAGLVLLMILFSVIGSYEIRSAWRKEQLELLGRLYQSGAVVMSEGELTAIFVQEGTENERMLGEEVLNRSGYGSIAYAKMEKSRADRVFLAAMFTLTAFGAGACIFAGKREENRKKDFLRMEEERTLREREQRNSKKEKTKMVRYFENIMHQIKTPLAGISVCQEYLEQTEENPERKQMLVECRDQIENIQTLVQQLLMSARLNAGSIRMKLERVTAERLRERIYRTTDYLQELNQIKILWEYEPDTQIFCDCFWVQEAIINLIRNAAGHTPPGGNIRISIADRENHTEIMVCDSGEGIPEEKQKDIFQRFYTSSVTETGKNAGIGLNLAYEIVTIHGGKLEVVPHEGEGAWFRLTLYQ